MAEPRTSAEPNLHATCSTHGSTAIVGLPPDGSATYNRASRGGCLKRESGKVIGRVVVDRTIRLDTGAARDAIGSELAGLAEGPPARRRSSGSDIRCSRCDTVVCESARAKLFSGMTLQCTGCGQSNRVPR